MYGKYRYSLKFAEFDRDVYISRKVFNIIIVKNSMVIYGVGVKRHVYEGILALAKCFTRHCTIKTSRFNSDVYKLWHVQHDLSPYSEVSF